MSSQVAPELTDLIEEAVLRALLEGRSAIPGQVIGYRPYSRGVPEHAYVELGLKRETVDGRVIELPRIDRVPILWPGASGYTASADLERGDELLCVVCDRAIDAWIDAGGVQVPRSGRLHDITDIVALPGMTSAKRSVTVRRGGKTYYIGTKDGQAPWMRFENRVIPTVQIEASEIKLGELATRGVARLNDTTTATMAWLTWFGIVGGVIGTAPPATGPFSSITSASSKVTAQ